VKSTLYSHQIHPEWGLKTEHLSFHQSTEFTSLHRMPRSKPNCADFRFYEELNDFLPRDKRKCSFQVAFDQHPAVKDTIEALGIPHTEVDLIIVNDQSVGFDYQLQDMDRVAVYPKFEALDIQAVNHLRPVPLRNTRFILDVHLGKLARWLRLLGFDCLYQNDFEDGHIVDLAVEEERIILTRDRGILKRKAVTHGYCIRSENVQEQIREVVRRFDLRDQIRPFERCPRCNSNLEHVSKEDIREELEPGTAANYQEFLRCTECQQLYWEGAHFKTLGDAIGRITVDEKAEPRNS